LTTEEIEDLPVQNLTDVVNLQAGVVDGHFRGGRTGEVQYQVDGVSINNAFDNSSSLNIDRSLLQEVQVISGTFDAEYGQAMSGVVNAILKQGGEEYKVEGEVYLGGFFFPGRSDLRRTDVDVPSSRGDFDFTGRTDNDNGHHEMQLDGTQNLQATVSGPLPLAKTNFLVSGRRYQWDDYVYGKRIFNPSDGIAGSGDTPAAFIASGDGEEAALGYTNEWSGVAKVTTNAMANTKLSYQALLNSRENRSTNWLYRYLPDALAVQRTFSLAHGFDLTHTLGPTTFLDFSARQNLYDYKDNLFDDPYDPRYDNLKPLNSDANLGSYLYQGVQLNNYIQKTKTYIFKGALVSQLNSQNQGKAGFELSLPEVEFGTPVYLAYINNALTRKVNVDGYPGPLKRYPVMGAAYVQDQLDKGDLIVRFGVRMDYFDARSFVPGDPANPANAIAGSPVVAARRTTAKTSLSPRVGVAYPIEDNAAVHFAYGHFRQLPSVSTMFTNSDYGILKDLQAGAYDYGVLGNPDVSPESTVQYEVGYKQVVNPEFGFDLTIYYKDIRDLLGVEFVETYTGATYSRLTNVDHGSALGVTLAVDHRQVGPLSLGLDYTWQQAMGNASDPYQTAVSAAAGKDPRPRLMPFNWDQRHTVNLTASLNTRRAWTLAAVAKVASGQPYTPETEDASGFGAATNSGRRPAGFLVDVRAEKKFGQVGQGGVFVRVFNLFDTRFFNGAVFPTTGSPYYTRTDSENERQALANPTRFYPPRRLELGVRWSWGGK
jgi:outer membrane receptor protein involved in Fe transport